MYGSIIENTSLFIYDYQPADMTFWAWKTYQRLINNLDFPFRQFIRKFGDRRGILNIGNMECDAMLKDVYEFEMPDMFEILREKLPNFDVREHKKKIKKDPISASHQTVRVRRNWYFSDKTRYLQKAADYCESASKRKKEKPKEKASELRQRLPMALSILKAKSNFPTHESCDTENPDACIEKLEASTRLFNSITMKGKTSNQMSSSVK